MTLERLTGLLKRAGIDPETGEKQIQHVVTRRASKEYLESLERTIEAFAILERTLARRRSKFYQATEE